MIECIQKLLAGGISPASVNTYLRGFKAYLRWLQAEGHTKETFKVQFLKTEARVLATLSTEQIKRLLDLRPKGRNETRAHIVALLILDGGYPMAPDSLTIVLMPGHLDAAELIFILLLAILLFGGRLGGRSWQEMADQFAREIQQLRQGNPQGQIDPATVRDLTVLGIVCTVLALELSWLATRL
jgi:hypothetical protein